MKSIKDMTVKELRAQKKMLMRDKAWAGIGFVTFYDAQIRQVNKELAKRADKKKGA